MLDPEALKGIINENRVGVLIQVNSGLIWKIYFWDSGNKLKIRFDCE